jgi:hypothetical protein
VSHKSENTGNKNPLSVALVIPLGKYEYVELLSYSTGNPIYPWTGQLEICWPRLPTAVSRNIASLPDPAELFR